MIDKDHKIMDMLYNIIEQTQIIFNDMEINGKTHYKYMLEKLNRAKYDLDILVDYLKGYENNDKTN